MKIKYSWPFFFFFLHTKIGGSVKYEIVLWTTKYTYLVKVKAKLSSWWIDIKHLLST